MKKYLDVNDYFFELKPWQQQTCFAIHQMILNANPIIQCGIKYNIPFYTYHGYLAYLGLYQQRHLILGFCQGHLMADEANLLKHDAGQKQIRHWRFSESEPINWELLIQYINEALIINEQLKSISRKKSNGN